MKKTILSACLMMAGLANAAPVSNLTMSVKCQLPVGGQVYARSFNGTGVLEVQAGTGASEMTLNAVVTEKGFADQQVVKVLTGTTKIHAAGEYMVHESYGSQLSAYDGDKVVAHLEMFLAGPPQVATTRLIIEGKDYYSRCDLVK